jgi:hypothetical protein
MRGKAALFGVIAVVGSSAATVLVAELLLQLLPVSEGTLNRGVDHDHPVLSFEPDDEVVYSRDWNFSLVNRFRVNRQGFVNKYDYDADPATPVLAVIGDSFVEATMVPYEETLQGRLEDDARSEYGGAFRVYSFGASGAPLSQYLVYARHARENYNVRSMIFVIVANDFDESLPGYATHRAFHVFQPDGKGSYELALRGEYVPVRGLLRQSALVRYLHFHLKVSRTWARLRNLAAGRQEQAQYADNTAADTSDKRMQDAHTAVDAFLRLLPSYAALPSQNIVLVVDAPRSALYAAQSLADVPVAGYFQPIRRYLLEEARERGYQVVDMAPYFFAEHKKTGIHFEWPTDGHWNGEGHKGAYEEVRSSTFYRRFLAIATNVPPEAPKSTPPR